MARKRKPWSISEGERPFTVVVYERTRGGPLQARCWDPALKERRRISLGHRDKDKAKTWALEQAAKLRKGIDDQAAGRVRLARLFALHRREQSPTKSRTEQQADARRSELWCRFLGAGTDPHKITLTAWKRFAALRGSGAIDARGNPVPDSERKQVRDRTVQADLLWLRGVLTWGTGYHEDENETETLLKSNPTITKDFQKHTPQERNPRRGCADQDRYERTRAVSDSVTMECRWSGRRETQRSYLSELLDLANHTGRRLSSIRQLRYDDLLLNVEPHGAIRWRAENDKMGVESTVEITRQARAALGRIRRERPGVGAAFLVPSPKDPNRPISRHLADAWLRKAERLAGVEPLPGKKWHAYRHKWASERKHHPLVDVAAAGGWAGPEMLVKVYMHDDKEARLRALLDVREVRGVQ